jgi:hypothetical protein
VPRLKHVVKLAEALLGSGAHLVVLERFRCSWQGDVRPTGGEVRASATSAFSLPVPLRESAQGVVGIVTISALQASRLDEMLVVVLARP